MNAGVQLNAFDPNSLRDLQRLARTDGQSNETLRAAARQFEALFLQMALKSMREATPSSSMFDSEQTRMYQSLLDQQLALNASQSRGTGLSEVIFRQLGGRPDSASAIDALVPSAGVAGVFVLAGVARRPEISAVMQRAGLAAGTSSAGTDPLASGDALAAAESALTQSRFADAIRQARDAAGDVVAKVRDFVADVWPHALEASKQTGIPAAFMVAQAALETGWGEKQLRHADGRPSHNLFNIKAGSNWQGETVDRTVTEYAGGQAYAEPSRFRAYSSYAESFADYARLMTRSPRYGAVLGSTSAAGFARALQDAGYATDPHYADKLTRIIGGATLRNALAGMG